MKIHKKKILFSLRVSWDYTYPMLFQPLMADIIDFLVDIPKCEIFYMIFELKKQITVMKNKSNTHHYANILGVIFSSCLANILVSSLWTTWKNFKYHFLLQYIFDKATTQHTYVPSPIANTLNNVTIVQHTTKIDGVPTNRLEK